MAKWSGAHYNQEVRFSSTIKCMKGPHVFAVQSKTKLLLFFDQFVNILLCVFCVLVNYLQTDDVPVSLQEPELALPDVIVRNLHIPIQSSSYGKYSPNRMDSVKGKFFHKLTT